MAHRTLNQKTAFYGDMRETGRKRKPTKRNKYDEAIQVYRQEFRKEPPFYLGAAYYMYKQLLEAGFMWSTRYGWRRKSEKSMYKPQSAELKR